MKPKIIFSPNNYLSVINTLSLLYLYTLGILIFPLNNFANTNNMLYACNEYSHTYRSHIPSKRNIFLLHFQYDINFLGYLNHHLIFKSVLYIII